MYKVCRVDIVLLSGDIANIPVECYANNGPQEVFDEHQRHLEKIVQEFTPVASKVYFLPGNVSARVLEFVPSYHPVFALNLLNSCHYCLRLV